MKSVRHLWQLRALSIDAILSRAVSPDFDEVGIGVIQHGPSRHDNKVGRVSEQCIVFIRFHVFCFDELVGGIGGSAMAGPSELRTLQDVK